MVARIWGTLNQLVRVIPVKCDTTGLSAIVHPVVSRNDEVNFFFNLLLDRDDIQDLWRMYELRRILVYVVSYRC